MRLNTLFLLLLTILPVQAFADWLAEETVDNQVHVMQFATSADGWQERTGNWSFSDRALAEAFISGKHQEVQVESPVEGRELRGSRPGVLWTATSKWNWDWEIKFAKWIRTDVNPNFFVKYGIATDCAEVMYSLRWIFARMHKLEMASSLGGSGNFLTHNSLRDAWAQLPTADKWYEDKRFRAALEYLLENTYTHTLVDDAYPIQISRKAIQPGSVYLMVHKISGHTQPVWKTDEDSGVPVPFEVIQSTSPRAIRKLMVSSIWQSEQPKPEDGGMLRMRWPHFAGDSVQLVQAEQMPYYSAEQYDKGFLRTPTTPFYMEIYLRLNPNLDMHAVALKLLEDLKAMLQQRVEIVKQGFAACGNHQCPQGSQGYGDWSTPSRDERIGEAITQLGVVNEGNMALHSQMLEPFLQVEDDTYSLQTLLPAWREQRYSSDPTLPIAQRWGLSAESYWPWLAPRLEPALAKLAEKIKAGQDSDAEDLAVKNLSEDAFSYLSESPPKQSQLWFHLMQAQSLAINGEKLPLLEALSQILWMSPSHLDSVDMRWGKQSKKYHWLNLFLYRSFGFSSQGWACMNHNDGSWEALDLRREHTLTVMEGAVGENCLMSADTDVIFVAHDREIAAIHLLSRIRTPLTLPFVPSGISFHKYHLVAFDDKTGSYLLADFIGEPDHQQWQIVFSGQGHLNFFSSLQATPGFLVPENGGTRLWDLSGASVQSWLIPSLPPGSLLVGTSPEFALIRTPTSGTYIFVKKSGAILPEPEWRGQMLFNGELNSGVLRDVTGVNGQFFRIEDGGQVTLGQMLTGFASPAPGFLNMTSGDGHKMEAWHWSKEGLSPVAVQADEERAEYGSGALLMTETKTQKNRFRRDNQTLFEISGINLLIGAGTREPTYFLHVDPATGIVGFRPLSAPEAPLLNMSGEMLRFGGSDPNYGTFLPNDIWVK